QQGRNSITHLMELLGAGSKEKVVVGESLQTRRLPHSQTAALFCIIVNEVVPILGYMAGNGRRWLVSKLNPESVAKAPTFPTTVIGLEARKIEITASLGRAISYLGKYCGISIAA